jgi:NAD(P) transhydrogenase subunit beta
MTMMDFSQPAMAHAAIGVAGLISCYVLMFGLWRMSLPATSAYGMRIAGGAMLVAVLAGGLYGVGAAAAAQRSVNGGLAAIAIIAGGGIAWWRAARAEPAALPRFAAIFGGLGAAAVAAVLLVPILVHPTGAPAGLIVTLFAELLATVSFSGSLMAAARLGGKVRGPVRVTGRGYLIGGLLVAAIVLGVQVMRTALGLIAPGITVLEMQTLLALCGLLCGVTMSITAGALELPVAESLYNALAGAAVAAVGVSLQIPALIVVGMLVAGAGLVLARLFAKSMNRPTQAADAAIFMRYARKVVIVPGYGLAVAQAQQTLHIFIVLLQAAGVDVKVALHPMAGRMPEQMAQLLAEAGVPETLILPSGDIDESLRRADVALVIGANDVVNPAANTIKSLPVFGLPHLDATLAERIYVIKRGAGRGYAGIANPSFLADHCKLVLGDSQTVLAQMVACLRLTHDPAAA